MARSLTTLAKWKIVLSLAVFDKPSRFDVDWLCITFNHFERVAATVLAEFIKNGHPSFDLPTNSLQLLLSQSFQIACIIHGHISWIGVMGVHWPGLVLN